MLAPPPLPRNLEASIRDLSSPTAAIRQSAALDLVRHALLLAEDHHLEKDPSSAVAKRAKKLLADANPSVSLAAAILLARGGDADARNIIRTVIRDGLKGAEPADEQAAIEIAGEIDLTE